MVRSALGILSKTPLPLAIIISSLLILAVLWALALFSFPKNTPAAILHYSVGVGIDFIGEGRQILILPVIGSTLLALNIFLWKLIARTSPSAGWVLLGTTPLIQIILLTAFILLWKLN